MSSGLLAAGTLGWAMPPLSRAEILNVFSKGFALRKMPLFNMAGDMSDNPGLARRLSGIAYGWLRIRAGNGVSAGVSYVRLLV